MQGQMGGTSVNQEAEGVRRNVGRAIITASMEKNGQDILLQV